MDDNPTIHTDKDEAERDARGRLLTMKAARAIGRQVAEGKAIPEAQRVALLDAEGKVVLEADLA